MKLVVETIYSSLEQEIDCITDNRIQIGSIIPYLYFHNLSSGVFKFEIKRNNLTIFEKQFTYEDIKGDKIENYFHVYYPIVPNNPLPIESGSYSFKISVVSGYEVSGNSFLGWIKQHEDIQLPMSYNPISDIQNTLTIRFKEYKDGF